MGLWEMSDFNKKTPPLDERRFCRFSEEPNTRFV